MDRKKFKHSTEVKVRNYEIDWQGVVHNAVYLLYCESGRLSYLQDLGLPVNAESIRREARMMIVRNEITYRSPARFGDVLTILTRISTIGNTSFTFEGIVEDSATGRIISENVSVHVWLDPSSGRPARIPEDFRNAIQKFEGKDLEMRGLTGML